MPFNIIDSNGHPIGVMVNRYTIEHPSSMIFMVGLTQQSFRPTDIDIDKIRENIAYSLECQSLFGTIKEEKFDQALRDIWHKEFNHLGYFNENFLIRRLMLNRSVPMENYLNLQGFDFQGYVLLDGKNLQFSLDGAIVLDMQEFEFELPVFSNLGVPLYCKTTAIPEVSTKAVPTKQPWEMNHAHVTKLEIISGNVAMDLHVESICPIKKDTVIQVYFEKEKIAAIYGDGILYKLT